MDLISVILEFLATTIEGFISWVQDSKMKTWQVVVIIVAAPLLFIAIAVICINFLS